MENNKSFEEKLLELETIVKKLESGDILLDDAIDNFNKAMNLAKECNQTLNDANETINKVLNKDGSFGEFKVDND